MRGLFFQSKRGGRTLPRKTPAPEAVLGEEPNHFIIPLKDVAPTPAEMEERTSDFLGMLPCQLKTLAENPTKAPNKNFFVEEEVANFSTSIAPKRLTIISSLLFRLAGFPWLAKRGAKFFKFPEGDNSWDGQGSKNDTSFLISVDRVN